MTENLDFAELCEIEPKLKDLYDQVVYERKWREIRDANLWKHYKRMITDLVGSQSNSGDPRLKDPVTHTLVTNTIILAMNGDNYFDHTGEV